MGKSNNKPQPTKYKKNFVRKKYIRGKMNEETNLTDVQEQFLKVLENCFGIVTQACKVFGDMNRSTFYKWMKTNPKFAERVKELEEVNLDFAEGKLLQNINDNDTTSIIFYLKTKGKKRGYIEKMEFDNMVNMNAKVQQVDLTELTPDEIVMLAKIDEKIVRE